jgi:uncharacterized membrane protein YbhN (UPF0104 family)
MPPVDATPRPTPRGRAVFALKLGITCAVFAYLGTLVPREALGRALGRATLPHFAAAVVISLVAIGVGAARWGLLVEAYGAPRKPSFARLFRLYLIGFFYNFLPGAVGGDVVRGLATRESFGAGGGTAGVAVVLVERVLGLTGLLCITATMALLRPAQGTIDVLPWSLLGLGIAACAVLSVSLAHRVAHALPAFLRTFAARLPALTRPGAFALALLLSLGTQALVALGAHAIVMEIAPTVTLADSLALVPLASAAAYFPLTPGGAGAREGAFVALFGAIGVAHEDALAASLLILAANLVVAALGGALQLATPRDADTAR